MNSSEGNQSVFRPEALQQYIASREEAVLPKLISPRAFILLWTLITLLFAGGVLGWLASVPVYAEGLAVAVEGKDRRQENGDDLLMVIFLPPDKLSQLKMGQRVFFNLNDEATTTSGSIFEVETRIFSPKAAQEYFALSASAAAKIDGARAVVFTRLDAGASSLPASSSIGASQKAWVEIGSRRVISMLPFIGRMFDRPQYRVAGETGD